MKLSHNWLRTYVPHELTSGQLAHLLTMEGLEVEEVETLGAPLDGVVVGEVLETRRHPGADRLTLCRVDLGVDVPAQIVCGAPNVAAGQKVPVATVGTTLLLPGRKDPTVREPVTLKKAKIRGEESSGMICAADELGLSDDHSGIMVLDPGAIVGSPFSAYLAQQGIETTDAVLDVNITPNRPDAISHIGIARDVSALTDVLMAMPEVKLPRRGGKAAEQVKVKIKNADACGRYVAMIVRGVRIAESPDWLKRRLTAVGLRPRNNVVDATNFVMYECGQPLHAFDLEQIAGPQITVRDAKAGEPFTTLDGKQRLLPEGTLLICDAERPVAIAGIMGGENSEVADTTTSVLIESAYFDPSTIRRAAKALGMGTDASYRFERGVDPNGQVWAAARAAQLIADLAGGEIIPGMVDAHPRPAEPLRVTVRRARVASLLGVDVPPDEVTRLLTAIGFEVATENPLERIAETLLEGRTMESDTVEDVYYCVVPSFRPDITREVDVIEEIARLYGFDRIPELQHSALPHLAPVEPPAAALRRQARSLLVGMGFREVYTNSMLRAETAEVFDAAPLVGSAEGGVVSTLNPISQEMAALRPSLLPGMLAVMGFNRSHGRQILRFMEFGHVFLKTDRLGGFVPGYNEREMLTLTLAGPHAETSWDTAARAVDFFDLKGMVEALLSALHVPGAQITASDESTALADHHAQIRAGAINLGTMGLLSGKVADGYDLKEPVYFAELDWSALTALASAGPRRRYVPVNRFPTVGRDLAVVVDHTAPVGDLVASIRASGDAHLHDVTVFDVYEGVGIEKGKKSVAFSLSFSAPRTLRDSEVDAQMAAIIKRLEKEHHAQLRT